MRVYLPATLASLARAYAGGGFGPAPLVGFGVTPALREFYADGDEEELEYAALTRAARASVGLLAAERSGNGPDGRRCRRVVVACDADAAPPSGAAEIGDARLEVRTPVPWTLVASVHVDAAEAAGVVGEAVAAWAAAQNGDQDAAFAVDACEGEELLWYATQEVPDLLAEDDPAQRS